MLLMKVLLPCFKNQLILFLKSLCLRLCVEACNLKEKQKTYKLANVSALAVNRRQMNQESASASSRCTRA